MKYDLIQNRLCKLQRLSLAIRRNIASNDRSGQKYYLINSLPEALRPLYLHLFLRAKSFTFLVLSNFNPEALLSDSSSHVRSFDR